MRSWLWIGIFLGCTPTLDFGPPTDGDTSPDAATDARLTDAQTDPQTDARVQSMPRLDAQVVDMQIDMRPPPGPCMAGAPEQCNAYDDDCDGLIDEEVQFIGQPCTVGENACEETGVWLCSDGWQRCSAVIVDAGCPCDAGHQVGCTLPDMLPECSQGIRRCVNGTMGSCESGPTEDETCDGFDNDCDTRVDEDVAAGNHCVVQWADCTFPSTEICAGADGIICDETTQPDEVCDGEDQDCDGVIDEGVCPDMGVPPSDAGTD